MAIFDLSEASDILKRRTVELCSEDANLQSRVTQILTNADFQIDGFSISKEDTRLPNVTTHTPPDPSSITSVLIPRPMYELMQDTPGLEAPTPRVQTQHRMIGSEDIVAFEMEQESNGTQRLFALAAPFLHALDTGGIMMVDELDCSLHPNLTRKLIELFQSPSANSRGAQLDLYHARQHTSRPEGFSDAIRSIWWKKCAIVARNTFRSTTLTIRTVRATRKRSSATISPVDMAAVPQFGPTFEDFQPT